VADAVAALPEGARVLLLAPLFPGASPDAAAALDRARDYTARPTYLACQYCAYREICPKTAYGGGV